MFSWLTAIAIVKLLRAVLKLQPILTDIPQSAHALNDMDTESVLWLASI